MAAAPGRSSRCRSSSRRDGSAPSGWPRVGAASRSELTVSSSRSTAAGSTVSGRARRRPARDPQALDRGLPPLPPAESPRRRHRHLPDDGLLRLRGDEGEDRPPVPRLLPRPEHRPALRPRVHLAEGPSRSEEHTSELQSLTNLVCRLLLEKKKNT